jgi:HTH-type transcriptional regulator, cell division transcriptional repressor
LVVLAVLPMSSCNFTILLQNWSKPRGTQKYNYDDMQNIVGKRVQEARLKFKPSLSQEELAARLQLDGWKISRGTLSKIEAGLRRVTDFELLALAKTLKVTPQWLLDEELFTKIQKRG